MRPASRVRHTDPMPVRSEDLAFAHALADAADAVSTAQFRWAELTKTTKDDGTPVSQVDLDVEEAMLAMVRAERPDDALLGEEVGRHAGTSGRRWIVDGIDGTHNYARRTPGLGDDHRPRGRRRHRRRAGVRAPLRPSLVGRARRGSMVGPVPAGRLSRREVQSTRLCCTTASSLAEASVIVIPHEGVGLRLAQRRARSGSRHPASRGASASPSTPRWWPTGEFDVADPHASAGSGTSRRRASSSPRRAASSMTRGAASGSTPRPACSPTRPSSTRSSTRSPSSDPRSRTRPGWPGR